MGTTNPVGTLQVNGTGIIGGSNLDNGGADIAAYHNLGAVVIGENRSRGAVETDFISSPSAPGQPGGFGFYVAPAGGNTINPLMYIQGDTGNVGVGTTAPGASLEVAGSGAKFSGALASETHSDSNVYAGVLGATPRIILGGSTTHEIDNASGIMRLFRPGIVDMQIDGSGTVSFPGGNVGIGTTSPAAKLDVSGAALFRNGSDSAGGGAPYTLRFGYGGSDQYQHYIRTRHNSANATNAIDFYVSDGTANGVFPTNAVHTMSLVSGNVGIGTTSPGYKLEVAGTAKLGVPLNNGLFIQENDGTTLNGFLGPSGFGGFAIGTQSNDNVILFSNNSERMRITSSGNVGIGTTSPGTRLDVYDNTTAQGVNNVLKIKSRFNAYGQGSCVSTYIYDTNSSSDNNQTGRICGIFTDAGNASVVNSALTFYTGNSGTMAEKMRIDKSGNVGIGTTSPLNLLSVVASNSAVYAGAGYTTSLAVKNSDVTDGNASGIVFQTNDAGGTSTVGGGIETTYTSHSTGAVSASMGFMTRNAGTLAERMRIDNAGNVGVGTTSPGEKLDIIGNARATDFYSYSTALTTGTPYTAVPGGEGDGAYVTSLAGYGADSAWLKFDTATVANNDSKAWIGAIYNSDYSQNLYFYSSKQGNTAFGADAALNAIFSQNGIHLFTGAAGPANTTERLTIDGTGNVGVGTTSPGASLDVKSQINLTNSSNNSMIGIRGTEYGYSSGYKAVQVGATTGNYTLSLGYDPGVNSGGQFTGDGSEIITRNGVKFIQPNGTNNYYLNTLVMNNGNVGIGTTAPTAALTVTPSGTWGTNTSTNFIVGSSSTLGTSAGSYAYPAEFQVIGGNLERLQVAPYRRIAGSDWTGAGYRLQYAVDNSFTTGTQSFVEIGAADPENPGSGFISMGTGGSDRLIVNGSGNVGVGTTAPGASLEVAGSGAKFSGALASETHSDSNVYAGVLGATPRIILGGSTTHEIDNASGIMRLFRPGIVDMQIDGSGTVSFPGGNVGVGTTSPAGKLTVTGNTEVTDGVAGADTASYGSFGVTRAATANRPSYYALTRSGNFVWAMGIDSSNGLGFGFPTAGTQLISDANTQMTITSGGNVGIGTTTPASPLEVAGTIRADTLCDRAGANCKTINTGWTSTGAATSMIANWPDTLKCVATETGIFILDYAPFTDGKYYYRLLGQSETYWLKYNTMELLPDLKT